MRHYPGKESHRSRRHARKTHWESIVVKNNLKAKIKTYQFQFSSQLGFIETNSTTFCVVNDINKAVEILAPVNRLAYFA